MWKVKSGERVDGVIALDPSALGYLLAVTGPTRTADGTAVGADSSVSLSQSLVYARYAQDNDARRAFLLAVARAASNKILETHGSTTALFRAAGRAAGEGRLLVWAADPAIQAELAQTSVSESSR